MISSWPENGYHFPEEEADTAVLMEGIRAIRNVRTDMNVPPSRKAAAILVSRNENTALTFDKGKAFLERLAGINHLTIQNDKDDIPVTAISAIFNGGEFYIPLADLIDVEKEKARLKKELENLTGELERISRKLENKEFVGKAPEKVIDAEKQKRDKYEEMFKNIDERLKLLDSV